MSDISAPRLPLELAPVRRAAPAPSGPNRPASPPAAPPADVRVGRPEELERIAREAFPDAQGKLSIRYDEGSGRFVYREIDPATGEVLREFPPEEVLERLARMKSLAGASFDWKA